MTYDGPTRGRTAANIIQYFAPCLAPMAMAMTAQQVVGAALGVVVASGDTPPTPHTGSLPEPEEPKPLRAPQPGPRHSPRAAVRRLALNHPIND
jgi:hypothetical protein